MGGEVEGGEEEGGEEGEEEGGANCTHLKRCSHTSLSHSKCPLTHTHAVKLIL